MPSVPLPVRDGLNPTRIRMPDPRGIPHPGDTVLEYLLARFPADAARLREKTAAGEIVDAGGRPIDDTTRLVPQADIYLYRDPPPETRVPFEIEILHRDNHLLVVDKPHFLATTPRGRFIVETALVRLRRELSLPDLVPAHRLDRLTAGVLVLVLRPADRAKYQQLFANRGVTKEYLARARHRPDLTFPRTVRSRIIKTRGILQAQEEDGEINAVTDIELTAVNTRLGLADYLIRPHTGKTHQIRVHMNALGIPLVGDSLYPTPRLTAPDDYRNPLALISRSISFVDPITNVVRHFTSARALPTPEEAPSANNG